MNKDFFTDAASKGAVLGVLMLVSHIFEQSFLLGGSLTRTMWVGLEMIVVVVLYIYLMYRFAKNASVQFATKEGGYSYGAGLLYVITLSLLTGVIVGLGGYVHMHYFIGYESYIDGIVKLYESLLANAAMPASMAGVYDQMIDQIQAQPEPSALSTLWSSLWSYLLWGLIIGLIIAGIVKREPKLFDEADE